MHSKRGTVTTNIIEVLKLDLNLLRVKWNKMDLSYMPKFHLLHEYEPFYLQNLDRFCKIDEDAIEIASDINETLCTYKRTKKYGKIKECSSKI